MNEFRVEEWTIKESELLNEMKDRCLNGGQYKDEKAKEKFKMICHLEDYCVQYYQLLDYINQLEKGSYIEEGINGQWTNWKFEAENYKKVCDDLYKKVNQLETNIDEAIEYIKHSWWLRTDQTYDTSKDLKGWEVEELLSILKRGKE